MERILLALSALVLIASVLFISDLGISIIGAAGVLAIWARIAQANRQHQEQLYQLDQVRQHVRNQEQK